MPRLTTVLLGSLVLAAFSPPVCGQDDDPSQLGQLKTSASDASQPLDTSIDEAKKPEVTWHATLQAAIDDARQRGMPIFAVVGAPWCTYCQKLQAELRGAAEIKIARKWVLAKINADDEISDARELHANALPALRLLSSDGIVTSRRDGYAPVAELKSWLNDNRELTKARMPSLLTKEIAELNESEIETLISLMAIRDVTARRVVLNRLSEMPQHAVHPAIDLLASGTLAHQLSALQLLRAWEAPIEGLDPWEPASLSDRAVGRLKAWGVQTFPPQQSQPSSEKAENR